MSDIDERATRVFRWEAGMVDTGGFVCIGSPCGKPARFIEAYQEDAVTDDGHGRLILTEHRANLGCMLAQVREARGEPQAFLLPQYDLRGGLAGWELVAAFGGPAPLGRGATEAEALVVAMEALG